MTIQKLMSLAYHHFNNHQTSDAAAACKLVLGRAPGEPNALHLLGLVARAGGDLAAAERLIREACGRAPSVADFHNSLGGVLAERGRAG